MRLRNTPFRAIFSLLGVTWAWGAVLVHSPRPPGKTPPVTWDSLTKPPTPVPGYKFKCPKGWTCPSLERPDTWRPPVPKGEVEVKEWTEVRI